MKLLVVACLLIVLAEVRNDRDFELEERIRRSFEDQSDDEAKKDVENFALLKRIAKELRAELNNGPSAFRENVYNRVSSALPRDFDPDSLFSSGERLIFSRPILLTWSVTERTVDQFERESKTIFGE